MGCAMEILLSLNSLIIGSSQFSVTLMSEFKRQYISSSISFKPILYPCAKP